MSAGVGFEDLSIDDFLEVQNKRYSQILYREDYIVYGFHSWYKILIFKEICRKPISQHPGLGKGLQRTQIRLLKRIVYTSGFSIRKPIFCNNHIYNFHVSEGAENKFDEGGAKNKYDMQ